MTPTGSNVAQQIAENGTSRASCAPAPVHNALTPFTTEINDFAGK